MVTLVDGQRRGRARWLGPWLLALAGAACQVSPEQIDRWKGTEKGPARLLEALRSSSVAAAVRGQALAALVEIGEFGDVHDALEAMPEATRREVVHSAVPPLLVMVRSKAGSDAASTTRLERAGKDGLFIVRAGAGPEDRDAIDDALIAWTTADLEGRMTAGAASGEKVLTAIGTRAGARLAVLATDAGASPANRMTAIRLLARVGAREQKDEAAGRILERARGARRIDEATFVELGLLGGDQVTAFLSGIAGDAKQPTEVRAKTLMAMSQAPDPAMLSTALRLAGDAKAPPEVRDAAFEVLAKLGPPAVPGMAAMLDDKNDKIRWEVVETMLLAGGAQAVGPVLEGLSPTRALPREDLRDFIVRDLIRLGPVALPVLREQLKSKSWLARVAAAHTVAEVGKPSDAALLDALAGDATRIKGWPGGATVGSEARTASAALRARR